MGSGWKSAQELANDLSKRVMWSNLCAAGAGLGNSVGGREVGGLGTGEEGVNPKFGI